MDPDAALEALIEAALDGDADELMEHAEDLADWLRKGGFAPSLANLREFVDDAFED